jgi:hypothetical protein
MILKSKKKTGGTVSLRKIAPMEQDNVSVRTAPVPAIQEQLATYFNPL